MRRRSTYRSAQRGFTLTELMVVVAIIAVLSALLVSVNSRTYGASASNVSDQIVATASWVKMRAVSTRRIHALRVLPTELQIWQSDITGFAASTHPDGPTPQFVQRIKIPSGVKIWDATGSVVTTTATPTENASLDHSITFRPDGSLAAGATLYVTDAQNAKKYRVWVYKATGSSYARESW